MADEGQHLPLNMAQLEQALPPKESDLDAELSEFFPPKRAGGRYSDSEIRAISNLLEAHGKTSWAVHPRLYIVLRMIDGLAHIDNAFVMDTETSGSHTRSKIPRSGWTRALMHAFSAIKILS